MTDDYGTCRYRLANSKSMHVNLCKFSLWFWMLELAVGKEVMVSREDHIPFKAVTMGLVAVSLGFVFTTWVLFEVFLFSRRQRLQSMSCTSTVAASFMDDLEMPIESEVVMAWHNVSCAYTTSNYKQGGKPKVIMALQKASGELHSGQITAIMGGRYAIRQENSD
jgi:hypothetical protein